MSQVGVIRRPRASVARRGNRRRRGEGRRKRLRASQDERWPRQKEKAATRLNRKLSRRNSFLGFLFSQPSINSGWNQSIQRYIDDSSAVPTFLINILSIILGWDKLELIFYFLVIYRIKIKSFTSGNFNYYI